MKSNHNILIFIILLISTFSFASDVSLLNFNQDTIKTCFDCHNTLVSQKIIHEPVKDACDNCHASNDNEHPKQGVKGFELADQPSALCFYCHEEYTKKKIHAPAESGECLSCHNVHSSNNKSLLTASSSNILCLQCHEIDIPKDDVVHSPVKNGKCSSCHDPHQSDHSGFLKNTAPQLCFDCHSNVKQISNTKNTHEPFSEDCFTCHQPHSGKGKALLTEPSPTLCFMCHGELEELTANAKHVHKPMNDGKSCVNCHSPHGSNENTLLIKNEKELCLSCHNKDYNSETGKVENIKRKLGSGNNIHAPVEDACINCHNPHATSQNSLLTNTFPKGSYVQKGENQFGLCFDCHDSSLLNAKNTTDATNFRHGNVNMHYLHVNDNKGKNCNLCHDVHGSRNPYLISDKVLFGKWDMNMNFKVNENGGSCATGCHAEKKYDRSHIDSLNQNIANIVNPAVNTGSRYDNYYENVHEIDSAVIVMNEKLEAEYQRKQDSIKGIEQLARIDNDTIQVVETHSDSNAVATIEKPELVEENTIENSNIDTIQEQQIADTYNQQLDTVIETHSDSLIAANTLNEELESSDSLSNDNIVSENANFINYEEELVDSNIVVENTIAEKNEKSVDNLSSKDSIVNEVMAIADKDAGHELTELVDSIPTKEADLVVEESVSETISIPVNVSLVEFPNVTFEFAKKTVDPEDKVLGAIVDRLKANANQKVAIHGYTDSIGSEDYNYYLSLQRAENVRDLFVSKGINRKRLRIKGFGEKNPIAPNNTPKGRALNRRVEFILIEE